jgi:hypothetical protein
VDENLLSVFHERTTYLVSLGISRQGYVKSSLIHGFGRTEDVPHGSSLSFTMGLEGSEFGNRPYYGFSYSWSFYRRKIGYAYNQIQYGTFLDFGIEQGMLSYTMNYYSPLLNKRGRYKFRLFNDIEYVAGYQRFDDEFLEFTKNVGVRGLGGRELRGNQRLSTNIETVCYSPHYLLGFRFLYFVFFDAGIISNRNPVLVQNPAYTGFGAGVRIRNENLIFDIVQIRLSYYPKVPETSQPEYLQLTSFGYRKFNSFINQQPKVLQYQTR